MHEHGESSKQWKVAATLTATAERQDGELHPRRVGGQRDAQDVMGVAVGGPQAIAHAEL